jgi:hypothetical protein
MFTAGGKNLLVQGIPTRYSNLIVKGCLYVSRPVFVALLLLLLCCSDLLQMLLLIMSLLLMTYCVMMAALQLVVDERGSGNGVCS